MTFPTVQARNTTALGSVTGAQTHNLPAGISAGDFLLIVHSVAINAAGVSTPAGWNSLGADGGGNTTTNYFWKFPATGSEGTTISITQTGTGGTSSVAFRITGTGGGIMKGSLTAAATNAPDPPQVQPGTIFGTGDHLYIETCTCNAAQASATASANYGNLQRASNVGATITAERQLTGNSDNPGTMSIATSTNIVANTLAIQQSTPFYPWTRIRNYIRRRMRY